ADPLSQVAYYKNEEKGEEQIWWSQEYKYDVEESRSTTVYTYNPDNELLYTTGYRDPVTRTVIPDSAVLSSLVKISRTYYDSHLGKGEEIVDYSDSYKFNGDIRSRTAYFYHTETISYARASQADFDSYLVKTETRKDPDTKNRLTQVSYYKNPEKGEELVSWSQEYDLSEEVESTTINTHNPDDSLAHSTVYKDWIIRTPESIAPLEVPVPAGRMQRRTFFRGAKGEEVADYVFDYTGDAGSETVSKTTIYFYQGQPGTILRAASADRGAPMKVTAVYKGVYSTAGYNDKQGLKTRTHFFGEKGEELADFSQNFISDGQQVKETTIYEYDIDALRKTTAYRGGVEDSKDTAGFSKRSETYFDNRFGRGEEITDYALNYRGDAGSEVISTTSVYFYENHDRSGEAESGEAMTASATYKGDRRDALYSEKDGLKARTHFSGGKGEELAEFSQTFTDNGQAVRETTIYSYYGNVLEKTTTFKGGTEDSNDTTGLRKQSETYFDTRLGKGEEITDYTYTFSGLAGSERISRTTVYFYENHDRADGAESGEAMTASATYKGDYSTAVYTDKENLKTRSHFFGDKGEELVDFSQNFRRDQLGNVIVKETILYDYDIDVLQITTTYQGGQEDDKAVGGLRKKNETHFYGTAKGEEIIDYSLAFKGEAGSESVSRTTVYFYQNHERAGPLSVDEPMTAQAVYKGSYTTVVYADKEGLKSRTHFTGYKDDEIAVLSQNFTKDQLDNVVVKDTTLYAYITGLDALGRTTTYKGGTEDSQDVAGLAKISESFFEGEVKGEEIMDYTLNYKGEAGSETVSRTTVYFYQNHLRADPMKIDEAMTASAVYKGDRRGALYAEKNDLKSRTHFFGEKGEELVDFSQTFKKDPFGVVVVKETTLYEYDIDVLEKTSMYVGGTEDSKDVTGLALKSETYFWGNIKGDEIMDFTLNYKGEVGQEVVSRTTIYFYDDHARAASAGIDEAMSASAVYKGDYSTAVYADKENLKTRSHFFGDKGEELVDFTQNFMYDGTIVKETIIYEYDIDVLQKTTAYREGTEDSKDVTGLFKKSETFFSGTAKGEELTDYTLMFRGAAGAEVISRTSVYFYKDHKRAELADSDEAMTAQAVYKGNYSTAVYTDKEGLKTRTHFMGDKGEELVEYSQNFRYDGTAVKDTTVYDYDVDILQVTTTYKGGTEDSKDVTGLEKRRANYFEGRASGEEIMDYTLNYSGEAGSETVYKTTVYFYTPSHERAILADFEDAMTASAVYKGNYSTAVYEDGVDLMSRSHFIGDKGEERVDFSQNFMNDGTYVKDTTLYEYDIDVMQKTTTYRKGAINSKDVTGLSKRSETFFQGSVRGEELADYTFVYDKPGAVIQTTTVYFYGENMERADVAEFETPKAMSVSFDGDKSSVIGTIDADHTEGRRSKTFYTGEFAEEMSDYALIYASGDPVNALHTNYYLYGSDYTSAANAVPGDRLSKIMSFAFEATRALPQMEYEYGIYPALMDIYNNLSGARTYVGNAQAAFAQILEQLLLVTESDLSFYQAIRDLLHNDSIPIDSALEYLQVAESFVADATAAAGLVPTLLPGFDISGVETNISNFNAAIQAMKTAVTDLI
ncbi:MAG: hypothetical protein PVH45_03265, partial [Candidatus Omnitrophota bacterium]